MLLPSTLPWYQFLETVSLKVLPAAHAPSTRDKNATVLKTVEHGEDTIMRLARYDRKHLAKIVTPAIVQLVLHQLVRRTLQIIIRSRELAKLQIASLNVDWVAAQFSSMLPESFAGQNLQRASSLIGNKHQDQQSNMLHMLIYLASNHLVMDEENILTCSLLNAEALILMFRLSDLGSPRMLYNLIRCSRESLTLAAVVEELFQAAMRIGAVDIVADILNENPWMITQGIRVAGMWPVDILPPLHYAVCHGSTDLVNLLLKFQADVNEVSDPGLFAKGWTPLALAGCRSPHQMSCKIANQLLQNGAMPDPKGGYSPLASCLGHGNMSLALQLIELGAAGCCFNPNDLCFAEGAYGRLCQSVDLLRKFSIFGLAVCVSDQQISTFDVSGADAVLDDPDELVVLKFLEALQVATKLHCGSDAMILAASRGHLRVMSYLRTKLGQAVDTANGALSPLYAAVLWGQVDAARQLLEWGASASMDKRLQTYWNDRRPQTYWNHSQHGLPTPLHIAIQFGPSDMVKLLIHYGGEVNQPSQFFTNIYSKAWDPSQWRPERRNQLGPRSKPTRTCSAVSPLLFAVLQKRWGEAGTLLALGAEPSGEILFEASEHGQQDLVASMLENGVRPDESSEWGLSALEAAAAQGHESVVLHLLRAGATVLDTSFAAFFCLPGVSSIRTLLQAHSEWPTLRDEQTNRSYLENAILRGHKDVVDFALQLDQGYYDSGALCAATSQDIMFHSPDTHLVLQELVKRRERCSCIDSQIQLPLESTAISMAAFHDRSNIVELLLRNKIPGLCQAPAVRVLSWEFSLAQNKRICDEWHVSEEPDASPLDYAAEGQSEQISLRLLQEGYCPDISSILTAMSHLKDDMIEMFIDKCENVNISDHGWTLLQEAVHKRNMPLVKRLLAKGADVNMYEWCNYDEGFPALSIAVAAGNLDLVSFLLENGADVNKGHSSGARSTALQYAVAKGYISIVKCLITHNADTCARRYPIARADDPGHGTPLEEAAYRGRLDIVHLLLERGVSTTGYHRVQYVLSIIYAQKSGNHTVVQTLYNHRPWSLEDQEIYEELTEFPPDWTIFFHPKEYPKAEFLRAVTETLRQLDIHHTIWRWWKDVPLVRGIGMVGDIPDTELESSFDEYESNEEERIEDPTDESESNLEGIVERMDENSSAGPGIENATFQNDSTTTPFNDNGGFGSHGSFSIFPQLGASMNADYSRISWPYDSSSERPEGNGVSIPMDLDSQTSQYSFERDSPSIFHPVGEMMDAFDLFLWPSNDVFGDNFDRPAYNDMNMSTDPGNWNLDPTFNGGQHDAGSRVEFEDMFDLSEWF